VFVPISVARFETNTWAKLKRQLKKVTADRCLSLRSDDNGVLCREVPERVRLERKEKRENGLASKVALKNLAHFIDI